MRKPSVLTISSAMNTAPTLPDNPSPDELKEFYASLRKAHADARPKNYFMQWPTEYLIAAGLPHDWMIKCGLIKPDSIEDVGSDCPQDCSIRELCVHLGKVTGTTPDKMKVAEALNTWMKPARKDKHNPIKRDIAVKLWMENVGGTPEDAKTAADYKREILKVEKEQKQLELDKFKKENDGKWGLVASMKSAVLGLAAILAGYQDRFFEDKDGARKIVREAAARCGATEEFILRQDAELAKDLPAANDALKTQCAIEGEKCFKRFEADNRERMKANERT